MSKYKYKYTDKALKIDDINLGQLENVQSLIYKEQETVHREIRGIIESTNFRTENKDVFLAEKYKYLNELEELYIMFREVYSFIENQIDDEEEGADENTPDNQ
jgi:hypothetical protein